MSKSKKKIAKESLENSLSEENLLDDSNFKATVKATEEVHQHTHRGHPHVHSEESLRRLVNRLSRIEGHVRGIKTMVQQNSPCPEVLLQIAAVRGALDRVARIVLDEHLTECIARAAKEGDIEEELEHLKAALDRFLP
jgi:CsoR family transcriptional regulator, copper-sensing transcriptional repressor